MWTIVPKLSLFGSSTYCLYRYWGRNQGKVDWRSDEGMLEWSTPQNLRLKQSIPEYGSRSEHRTRRQRSQSAQKKSNWHNSLNKWQNQLISTVPRKISPQRCLPIRRPHQNSKSNQIMIFTSSNYTCLIYCTFRNMRMSCNEYDKYQNFCLNLLSSRFTNFSITSLKLKIID